MDSMKRAHCQGKSHIRYRLASGANFYLIEAIKRRSGSSRCLARLASEAGLETHKLPNKQRFSSLDQDRSASLALLILAIA